MPNPQGFCIFCGGPGLTKEHLFSDWFTELFPRSSDDTHTLGEAYGEAPYTLSRKQGHSGSRKIRKVCSNCNSGWVGTIDNKARQSAPRFIRGETALLSQDFQKELAAWFAKIAMVGDSRKPSQSVVPQTQRSFLMTNGRPPNGWQVWLASYSGSDYRDLGLFQRGGRLDFSKIPGPGTKVGYAQTTFMGMGKMTALVLATDFLNVEFSVGAFSRFARSIWPTSPSFMWPLETPIDDALANSAADILKHMVANFR